MKAKKGQILILVLMIMAIGLIVITPLLRFMNTSYNSYSDKFFDTGAYYTADAMMEKILSDLYASEDIYALNKSNPSPYNNKSTGGWLNGYGINTSINTSIVNPPPAPSGDTDYIYRDPGTGQGLGSLQYGQTYSFKIYLTERTNLTVNWAFGKGNQSNTILCKPCTKYHPKGSMWLTYSNGTKITTPGTDVSGEINDAQLRLVINNWSVPQSDNYYINFKGQCHSAKQTSLCSCSNNRDEVEMTANTSSFSGIGDPNYTWVRLGAADGKAMKTYQDYTIKTTASQYDSSRKVWVPVATITACVRQSPNPLLWEEDQSLDIISWQVTYY